MAKPIQMPNVGISVESCVLTKWHKKKGDSVKAGEVLFTYETDKTTVDEEAQDSGVILEIFAQEGDDVPVMQYVGVIGKPGEDFSEFLPALAASAPAPAAAPAAPAPTAASPAPAPAPAVTAAAPAAVPPSDGKIKISPRARAYAERTGIDASAATPTGAEGRIVEKDVAALKSGFGAASAAPAAAATIPAATGAEYTEEKLSSVRKVIARTMHESISSMAQLTHNSSFDATNILEFRKVCKEKGEALNLPNITINDIILYAVSRVLPDHKYLNAHFLGESMRFFHNVNLGMAVDTERGLLVPTIFNANKMSLVELAAAAKSLAKQAQGGSIAPDALKGGSFTVSNLGALGIESFTPIVNPPQTAILGVNCLKDAIKVVGGEIKAYKSMTLSLTYDHRAVDGAPASRFLKDLCTALESFSILLAK